MDNYSRQTQLRRGLEQNMDYLKMKLIGMGYEKTSDGKTLDELTLTELIQVYENVKYRHTLRSKK